MEAMIPYCNIHWWYLALWNNEINGEKKEGKKFLLTEKNYENFAYELNTLKF